MKSLKRQLGFTLIEIILSIFLVIGTIGMVGWVKNIIRLTEMSDVTHGMGVVRIIGIPIAPIGMIVGYMSN